MQQLRVILKGIEDGKHSYQPEQDDFESLKSFQDTVKRLMFAKEQGYIFDLIHQIDHRHPGRLVRNLYVKGGLTLKGDQFLISPPDNIQTKEPEEDMIDIKPNIAGIGVNFNAVYRWVKRKIKN